MRLNDLIKYGIPKIVTDAWSKRQGDYLLPLQTRAVQHGLLQSNDREALTNLLISAPTSSGKSFCGEMAAIASLLKRRKVIMLLPLKSIAEEKYLHFTRCYQEIGIRTIIVTGDHPENDLDFELGNFDFALAIYEKFNRLLTVNLDILGQIGLIIVDELQMIADPKRGGALEMALTKVRHSVYEPRIVALSAVLHDEEVLSDWLNGRLISEAVRPVDLLQGIVTDGYFHFKSFNSGLEGREKFPLIDNGDGLTESLIDFLKKDQSRKLIFLKSRRSTVQAAFKLAAVSGWKEAKETLAALDCEENSYLVRSLRQVVSRGVAFHNADLTPQQRRAIETGYRQGEIKVIFSTITLAMGVNLPAEIVFLETMKYCSGEFGGKPQLIPITVGEFQNISGRAGRFGFGPAGRPGRAMVLAESDFEYEVLWSGYIDCHLHQKINSALERYDIRDICLDLIVSGLITDLKNLERVLHGTFCSKQSQTIKKINLSGIIDELISFDLVTRDFLPTPFGVAAAASGISVATSDFYIESMNKRIPGSLIGWLLLALRGFDFDKARAGLTSSEYHGRIYEKLYHRQFSEYATDIASCIQGKIGQEPLNFAQSSILKAGFLLFDWAHGQPAERLEQRYQLHLGQITDLAETAAWLLAAIRRLIEAGDWGSNLLPQLDEYIFSVQFGITYSMHDLHAVLGTIINRNDYRKLEENGVQSSADLEKLDSKYLAEIIRPPQKIKNLFDRINNLKREEKRIMNGTGMTEVRGGFDNAALAGSGMTLKPSSIELDGRYERERYLVKIDGIPVRLTGKSFKYLTKLACSRLMGDEGWVYKEDIEAGFNQARYLYRLKQEVNQNGACSWSIFENNRLGYYRLDLDPSKIKVNLDNLMNHHDFEIRKIGDELAPRMTN